MCDTITDSYYSLARNAISIGIMDETAAVTYYYQLCPGFKSDDIFNVRFPICFRIELCKYHMTLEH
jgi:hypothetical protein